MELHGIEPVSALIKGIKYYFFKAVWGGNRMDLKDLKVGWQAATGLATPARKTTPHPPRLFLFLLFQAPFDRVQAR